MVYVVDTNFFITAHRGYYPLDIFPGYWNKIIQLANKGSLVTIDKVKKELVSDDPTRHDDLAKWFKANFPSKAILSTASIAKEYAQVVNWPFARKPSYLPKAIDEFMSGKVADAFLIGICLTDSSNNVLVTYEKSQPNKINKIYIPDVCNGLKVQCISPLEMFRALGETF